MADLFGAPQGFMASEQANQQGLMTGLKAVETFGQIGMQPAELAIKQAQAKLLGAEFTQKDLANQQMRFMLGQDTQFNQEYQARQQMGQLAAAQGKIATVADLTGNSALQTLSGMGLYDKAVARIKWMEDNGVPEQFIAGERDKIASGLEHLAVGSFRQMEAQKEAADIKAKQWQELGGIAATAGSSEQAWNYTQLDPAKMARLPEELKGLPFAEAQPWLQTIAQSTIKAHEQEQLRLKKAEDAQKELRDKAAITRDNAEASRATAAADLAKTRRDAIVKDGGDTSSAAKEARDSTTTARDNADAAKFRAAYPAVPLDPKDRKIGRAYSNADGTAVATWLGDGKFNSLTIPIPRALSKAAKAVAAAKVESPDETGE